MPQHIPRPKFQSLGNYTFNCTILLKLRGNVPKNMLNDLHLYLHSAFPEKRVFEDNHFYEVG